PRPRPSARTRMGRADARDGGGARGAAEPFRRRDAQTRPCGLSAKGLRGADGDDGTRLRHEAANRKQKRADRARELSQRGTLLTARRAAVLPARFSQKYTVRAIGLQLGHIRLRKAPRCPRPTLTSTTPIT